MARAAMLERFDNQMLNRPARGEKVAMRGPAAFQERQGSPRSFRLRRASADAVRPALMAPAQARALTALIQDFENRVWQLEPVTIWAVEAEPRVVAAAPSSILALDKLVADYEAGVWGTEQLNSTVMSIDAVLLSEVSSSTGEVLDDLVASFERTVWQAKAIGAMPEIHLPATMAVSSSMADVLNALVPDFETKVWAPVFAANSEVRVDAPVALNVAAPMANVLDAMVADYEARVWETQMQVDVIAMDIPNGSF
jgi:hypothetical protein